MKCVMIKIVESLRRDFELAKKSRRRRGKGREEGRTEGLLAGWLTPQKDSVGAA